VSITVNNDKSLTTGTEAPQKNRVREPVQPRADSTAPGTTGLAGTPEPDVGRAAHLYQAAGSTPAAEAGTLRTGEQARSLLQELKDRILQDPAGALRAFSGPGPSQAAALLEGAPA
jgi:hypothetical protein